jgi:hypothetical protein
VIPLSLERRAGQTIIRAKVVEDLYLDLTVEPFHLAQDLVLRGKRCPLVYLGRDGHEIAQDKSSVRASEGSLENVGVGEVATFGTILPDGSNREAATLSRIQEGGEDGRAVEAREAEPVERAILGDEPRAPTIADEGIVIYRRVTSHFRSMTQRNVDVHGTHERTMPSWSDSYHPSHYLLLWLARPHPEVEKACYGP